MRFTVYGCEYCMLLSPQSLRCGHTYYCVEVYMRIINCASFTHFCIDLVLTSTRRCHHRRHNHDNESQFRAMNATRKVNNKSNAEYEIASLKRWR